MREFVDSGGADMESCGNITDAKETFWSLQEGSTDRCTLLARN